jgi:hypothetical protein
MVLRSHVSIATIAISLLLGGIAAQGQAIPITAKINERTDVIEHGKTIESYSRSGTFYRTADGSELYAWTEVNGKPSTRGSLWSPKTGNSYRLDLQAHSAIQNLNEHRFPTSNNEQAPLGLSEDSVEGIPCKVVQVDIQAPRKPISLNAGHACWSYEYDLELRSDVSVPSGADKVQHHVKRLTDIKPNAQIDEKLFDLSRYTVYKADK